MPASAALVAVAEPRGQASPPKPKPFPTLKTPIANFAKSNRPRGQFGIIFVVLVVAIVLIILVIFVVFIVFVEVVVVLFFVLVLVVVAKLVL